MCYQDSNRPIEPTEGEMSAEEAESLEARRKTSKERVSGTLVLPKKGDKVRQKRSSEEEAADMAAEGDQAADTAAETEGVADTAAQAEEATEEKGESHRQSWQRIVVALSRPKWLDPVGTHTQRDFFHNPALWALHLDQLNRFVTDIRMTNEYIELKLAPASERSSAKGHVNMYEVCHLTLL